ncbi:hypothetical protein FB45DRAFT_1006218 [Roridomyces roridus]|uniref:F-box domain-containing protein n=1 Tax=Roridomyces roridus TaxID=1738132 RepID=A0AAD7BIE1_9AGAR|nr:hypothetical protein FB45DRAFT_1006218 [Roridomyces roridus]
MDSHIIPACLESLFTSNLPPLDSEAAHLRHLLAAAAAGLNQVDSRIGALHEELAQLLTQRDDLVASMERYQAVLSPVRRIPPEVLCQILEWIPPSFQLVQYQDVQRPPWQIAHICRSWRETAIACPSLWTCLDIVHMDSSFFPTSDILEAQLARTASAPLRIDFELSSQSLGAASAWDSLLPLSHRWKSLHIQCSNPEAVANLLDRLQAAKGHLPLLEKVDFVMEEASASVDHDCDFLSTALRLREVHLTSSTFDEYSPVLAIPWAQLTSYRGVMPPARQLDNLRDCPNLIDCAIGYDEDPADQALATTVVLPLVRRLHVEHVGILAHMTAQSLQTLLIPSAASHAHILVTFLQRSSCQLNTLVITKCFDLDGIIAVLTNCTTLEHLILQIQSVGSVDIDGLVSLLSALSVSIASTNTNICPNLASIALGFIHQAESPVWGEALLRMLESRSQPQQRLRSACFFTAAFGQGKAFPTELKDRIQGLENRDQLDIQYLDEAEGVKFMAGLRP